ncbi:MAG: chemotaxis protein CheX [Vicinamibacterales bacterium]
MTSSATSPALAAPPDAREGLLAALAEVGELSFFGFVDAVPPDAFAESATAAGPWICAEVDYRGEVDGVVRVAVPAALAGDLMASFSGEPDAGDDVGGTHDLLGEFANMICGSWLTHTRPDAVFALGRPAVARMPEGWSPSTTDPDAVLATFNDQPVAVWLTRA